MGIGKIITWIIMLIILVSLIPTIDVVVGETYNCHETKVVPYRVIRSGGIFGGTRKIETTEQKADGRMEVCIKWSGLLFKSNRGNRNE